MALIVRSECGKEISIRTSQCIYCGYFISELKETDNIIYWFMFFYFNYIVGSVSFVAYVCLQLINS